MPCASDTTVVSVFQCEARCLVIVTLCYWLRIQMLIKIELLYVLQMPKDNATAQSGTSKYDLNIDSVRNMVLLITE